MTRRSVSIFTILLFCLMMAASVHAQSTVPIKIPNYLNYQGKLEEKDPNRDPIPANGIYTMTFRIYDDPDDPITECKWEETREVEVVIGIFNVALGEITPLGLEFEQDYWLGLDVDPNGEMTPRQRIVSTGYSFMAQDSYSLNGHEAGKGNELNVDMVDDIHASTTPQANNLLALDASGEFPNSVLKMGDGRGMDADTVDGVHYSVISSEIDNKVTNIITAHEANWGHLDINEKIDLTDSGETTLHTHSFSNILGEISDNQVPDNITINYAANAGNANTVGGKNASELGGIHEIIIVRGKFENCTSGDGGWNWGCEPASCPSGYTLVGHLIDWNFKRPGQIHEYDNRARVDALCVR